MNAEGGDLSRRSTLKRAGIAAVAVSGAGELEQLAAAPLRAAVAAQPQFSDIPFDIGRFVNPAQTLNDGVGNVTAQFGPVFSLFAPAKLNRIALKVDQAILAGALNTIENVFPASPPGALIASVFYGEPYFHRFPGALVRATIPRPAREAPILPVGRIALISRNIPRPVASTGVWAGRRVRTPARPGVFRGRPTTLSRTGCRLRRTGGDTRAAYRRACRAGRVRPRWVPARGA